MALKQEKHEWELPHLRESHQLQNFGGSDFWSVKFYPFTKPGVDPIFAVVGGKTIMVCRLPEVGKENKSLDVIQSVVDEEVGPQNTGEDLYACVWTKNLATGDPLLCVAGELGKVKIINALTGELHQTLAGHGGPVNDLVVSPTNPQIIASCSDDATVRLWSIDPTHTKQPCAAILAGDGHQDKILTLSFHATGNYILSGGVDKMTNLWALPEFPDSNTGTNQATLIHYPHFSTSEVHSGIVDCVAFFDDLIFSKCHDENCIVLWAITGFSSRNPVPSSLSAPTTHDQSRDTRSAFSPNPTASAPQAQYTRLLQFAIPDSDIMFMRFSLFPGSKTTNPVLAFCNTQSKVSFWDLGRLTEYWDFVNNIPKDSPATPSAGTGIGYLPPPVMQPTNTSSSSTTTSGPTSTPSQKRPPFLIPFKHRTRGGAHALFTSRIHSIRDSSPTTSTSTHSHSQSDPPPAPGPAGPLFAGLNKEDAEKSREIWERRYGINDPFREVAAHKEEVLTKMTFVGRQVAWSRGGEWCVVVGSVGVIGVFERWRK